MSQTLNLLSQHEAATTLIAAYVFLALVETMPAAGDTRPTGVKFYAWVYSFLHLISNKVEQKYPQLGAVTTTTVTPNGVTPNGVTAIPPGQQHLAPGTFSQIK